MAIRTKTDPVSPIDSDEIVALRLVLEGTADATGEDFFQKLVSRLAEAIDVQYAFVAEFASNRQRVKTLAFWAKNRIVDDVEYDLEGTPCQAVVEGSLCHYPNNVASMFPNDLALVDLQVKSYLGVPLTNSAGEVIGHLAVFDDRPMAEQPRKLFLFKIFATRAAAELQRIHLQQKFEASEKRYRDLFEEAPIPYVYEDTQTRFVSVNHAAMDLLGLKPGDVPGTIGMSLVAPDQGNKVLIEEAFADIRKGEKRGLGVLELRRKDTGKPVWVQFWSKPEPDGKHTRTMIIDITARVLAEREKIRLQTQNEYLQEEIKASLNFDEIIARSPLMNEVLENVRAVAPTDSSVLITGETGTGKELIAHAIHSASRRASRPLIKVNCAALPAGLIESELFGHEKGAFTGAIQKRIGRFELAHGGTIFLDEIGELPLDMQSKLLRVLQEHEIERVGGAGVTQVDVRVIAATNRCLESEIKNKAFREDLYYRLNVFPVKLPPLRERGNDIKLLASYFVDRYANQFGKTISGIEEDTLNQMITYPWPGNIRELQNVIERGLILAKGPWLKIGREILISPAESPAFRATAEQEEASSFAARSAELSSTSSKSLGEIDQKHILEVLQQTGWRIDGPRGAAKILGLHPNTLRSRMKKLGIVRP